MKSFNNNLRKKIKIKIYKTFPNKTGEKKK